MLKEQLIGKTQEEKVTLKSDAIVAEFAGKKFKERDIEIVAVNKIDGGVEVLARAWKDGKQIGFGKDGTVDIERFRIFNPPILVSDDAGDVEKVYTKPNGEQTSERFREDPNEALIQVIIHTIGVKKEVFDDTKIVKDKVGSTTSTFYPSIDGYARYNSTGVSWATIIAANGSQANTADTTFGWTVSGANSGTGASTNLDVLARGFLVFDTSAIPDADTISSATLSGYCTSKTDEFSVGPTMTIMGATLASDATIAASDFQGTFSNQTSFATAKTFADFTTSAYNDFALNASGLSAISKTGNSRFGLRFSQDITGGTTPEQATTAREFFVVISSVDETGTAQDPKLVVEHAGGSVNSGFLAFM